MDRRFPNKAAHCEGDTERDRGGAHCRGPPALSIRGPHSKFTEGTRKWHGPTSRPRSATRVPHPSADSGALLTWFRPPGREQETESVGKVEGHEETNDPVALRPRVG